MLSWKGNPSSCICAREVDLLADDASWTIVGKSDAASRSILGDRRLTPREAVSRHRARLNASGEIRVELVLSKQTLRTIEREARASGRSRASELRLLVEEALAKRWGRRRGQRD